MGSCQAAAVSPGSRPRARPDEGLTVTAELMDAFLRCLLEKGRTAETVGTYRRNLNLLYDWLPEDKRMYRGTMEAWRNDLLAEGYAVRTANLCVSAANSFLEYCGRREMQIGKPLALEERVQPELTRNEYLRLLSTARALGKRRAYLLVKVFGTTGLSLHDLSRLTVEAAERGKIALPASVVHIPACLRQELLDYARQEGVQHGPLFVTREGKPVGRSNVTFLIGTLCADARVDRAKGSPRCLKKLYQATRSSIQSNISLLVEQAHDRLLETEQLAVGWPPEEVERA